MEQKPLNNKSKKLIKKEFVELLSLAKEKAEKVYFITVPIAYDEEELPSVSLKWNYIFDWQNRGRFFSIDNKTYQKQRRLEQKFMKDIAQKMNVSIIDLDPYLRKKLKYTDKLFSNSMTLTPIGIKMSVDFMMNHID